jgi:hypothetical protein
MPQPIGARQTEVVAQHPQQRTTFVERQLGGCAVKGEGHDSHWAPPVQSDNGSEDASVQDGIDMSDLQSGKSRVGGWGIP